MKKMLMFLAALSLTGVVSAQTQAIPTASFGDAVNHWRMTHKSEYPRYKPEQIREIADNIVAYQNADGGWPKNLDMLAVANPDSVRRTIDDKHLRSTLDNNNVYTEVEYLCNVDYIRGDSTYRPASRRGFEYILASQYPNGGWRGWDVDAITFNDGIMEGVLSAWLDVLEENPIYAWVDPALKARIQSSFDRGLELVLKCQYVQDGVKTVWAQQYDHQTIQPCKARAYEFPSLSAGESAGVAMLLMRLKNPSPEVIEAVKTAVAWFDRSKITGKKVVFIDVPEGLKEDPSIKRDRVLLDDPEADPIWARYYELDTNRPFFATRAGTIVYTLAEVPAERRTGYGWYGTWGNKVLKKYGSWLRKVEKNEN